MLNHARNADAFSKGLPGGKKIIAQSMQIRNFKVLRFA